MRAIFFILVLIIFSTNIDAQDLLRRLDSLKTLGERPKIGLALSGGGAHGLSHIGVIKYLEENNIPIDYISGTSIGAIVGAMFSLGYSTSEMELIIEKNDWDDIISNNINLQEMSPFEKEYLDKIPFSLRIEKNRLLLPKAFFTGYKLDLKLAELFSVGSLVDDFSLLPRPFVCYSVDLLSGKVIELNNGSLANAVRASMSIPSIFTPVARGSMLLVDGGLVKNFPVEEVKAMGADIVIGSYVGSNRMTAEEVLSMSDVLKLTGFLTSLNDTELQKKHCDILIEPNVKSFPIFNFANFSSYIKAGYQQSLEKEILFNALKEVLASYAPALPVLPLRMPPEIFIENVKVKRKYNGYDQILTDHFSDLERKNISADHLAKKVLEVFSTNNLENLTYEYKEGRLGQILELDYQVKKESTIGININHFANSNTSLILNGKLRNVLSPMTIFRGFLRLSDNPGLLGSFYKRFGKRKRTLIGVEGLIEKYNDPVYLNRQLQKQYIRNNFNLRMKLLYEIDQHSIIGVDYSINNRNLQLKELRDRDILDLDQNMQMAEIKYSRNTLDEWSFPSSGAYIMLSASYIHNLHEEVTFTDPQNNSLVGIPPLNNNIGLHFYFQNYFAMSESLNLQSSISTGVYTQDSNFDFYRIGGTDSDISADHSFIGADQGSYRLKEFFLIGETVRLKISKLLFARARVQYLRGKSYNSTFINKEESSEWNDFYGIGIGIGLNTIFGPINIDIGSINGIDDANVSVGVGYNFIK